ncbi:MAG: hypothetical protein GF313_09750, partial [Caldithrix sp.]|nr:hypothetical protein [Caldithrix sp.]
MVSETKTSHTTISERQRLQIIYDKYRPEYERRLNRISGRITSILDQQRSNYTIKKRVKRFDSYFDKILRLRNENIDPIELNDLM